MGAHSPEEKEAFLTGYLDAKMKLNYKFEVACGKINGVDQVIQGMKDNAAYEAENEHTSNPGKRKRIAGPELKPMYKLPDRPLVSVGDAWYKEANKKRADRSRDGYRSRWKDERVFRPKSDRTDALLSRRPRSPMTDPYDGPNCDLKELEPRRNTMVRKLKSFTPENNLKGVKTRTYYYFETMNDSQDLEEGRDAKVRRENGQAHL